MTIILPCSTSFQTTIVTQGQTSLLQRCQGWPLMCKGCVFPVFDLNWMELCSMWTKLAIHGPTLMTPQRSTEGYTCYMQIVKETFRNMEDTHWQAWAIVISKTERPESACALSRHQAIEAHCRLAKKNQPHTQKGLGCGVWVGVGVGEEKEGEEKKELSKLQLINYYTINLITLSSLCS